jgi:hypothetical protein
VLPGRYSTAELAGVRTFSGHAQSPSGSPLRQPVRTPVTPGQGLPRDISDLNLSRSSDRSEGSAFNSKCPVQNHSCDLERVDHEFISLINIGANAKNTKDRMELIEKHQQCAAPTRSESRILACVLTISAALHGCLVLSATI